jgi:hypothetical protein
MPAPLNDPSEVPIPTVAFVSFWAGVLTAVRTSLRRGSRSAGLRYAASSGKPWLGYGPETCRLYDVHVAAIERLCSAAEME